MSGRRRKHLSPSLFPFLAVLVCTLGTLILLLALVAQNATTAVASQAEQASDPNAPQQLKAADADVLIDEAEFRVQHLVSIRDQQIADIENRRDRITHIEDHIARLKSKLKSLSDKMDSAVGNEFAEELDPDLIAETKSLIKQETENIEKLKAEKQGETPRVVIVPHKGPNGTDRRPIYLECTSKGLTIWPEGILLPKSSLENSVADANPLDAALRAIRHHALQNYGDEIAPYPLIIVRPSGIESYGVSLQAMRDWDDQFGYELVPENVELAFPKADPLLRLRLDDAIATALRKQVTMKALRGQFANVGGGSFGHATSSPRKLPTLSARSMDKRGRSSGYQDHREGYGPVHTQNNFGSQYGDHIAAGTGADAVRKLDDQLREATREMNVGDGGGIEMPSGNGTAQRLQGDALKAIAGDATGGHDGDGSGDGPGGGDGTGFGELNSPENNPANRHADSMRANPYAGNDQILGPSTPNKMFGGNSSTGNHFGGQPSADGTANGTSPNGSGSPPPQGLPPSAAGGGAGGAPTRSGMSGEPGSPSSQQSASDPSSSQMASQQAARQLVERSGTNWALPQNLSHQGGTAIVRTIRVQCFSDRFVLLPSRGSGATELFGVADGDVNRASLQLATSVRDRIQRWGAALPGGRWQPRLDVQIMPGGIQRFEQLESLLIGSGIDVTGSTSK